ncbi:MAG: DUF4339 domain-containing protein [Opitutaceae bacterium]
MYLIIGGDGKEYGPATADQIRKWLAAGRANLDTLARPAGAEGWTRLGDIPEFGPQRAFTEPPALEVRADGAVPSPSGPRSVRLDTFECFARSWTLFRENLGPTVGITLVLGALWFATSSVLQLLVPHTAAISPFSLAYYHSSIFHASMVVDVLFLQPLVAGYFYHFVKRARGEAASMADLFSGFSGVYPSLVLAGIAVQCLEAFGFICFVVPGVYFLVAYFLTPAAIVDHRVGFWRGMEISRRAIWGNWWAMFLLLIIGLVLVVAGLFALLVGALVTVPLFFGAAAYAYVELTEALSGSPAPTRGLT